METKRTIAFAIDFLIASLIQAVLMITFILPRIITKQIDIGNIPLAVIVITYISMLYMIFRDCFGNKSIGKRIMKLKIVTVETMKEASWPKRLIRNVTWIFGPIEIIYFLIKKERISDQLSKTKVIA